MEPKCLCPPLQMSVTRNYKNNINVKLLHSASLSFILSFITILNQCHTLTRYRKYFLYSTDNNSVYLIKKVIYVSSLLTSYVEQNMCTNASLTLHFHYKLNVIGLQDQITTKFNFTMQMNLTGNPAHSLC